MSIPSQIPTASLWEPYALLVALEEKRIETRDFYTSIRGPLAIHATKKWDEETWEPCLDMPSSYYNMTGANAKNIQADMLADSIENNNPPFTAALHKHGYYVNPPATRTGRAKPLAKHNLPLGAVLCIVNLVDCVKMQNPINARARRINVAPHHPVYIEPRDRDSSCYQDMLTPQEIAFGYYVPSRYALILEMIERFETPIPASGKQMFGWKWTRPDNSDIAVPSADEPFRLT